MVSRNLERANENDGFKMTALETSIERAGVVYFHYLVIRCHHHYAVSRIDH